MSYGRSTVGDLLNKVNTQLRGDRADAPRVNGASAAAGAGRGARASAAAGRPAAQRGSRFADEDEFDDEDHNVRLRFLAFLHLLFSLYIMVAPLNQVLTTLYFHAWHYGSVR